jgi:Asp-tRNA(Asn)/Glu-tRNA(Gln) amidotransferase B subunit
VAKKKMTSRHFFEREKMKKIILFVLLFSILFVNGCKNKRPESKESLEQNGYQINNEIATLIRSIDNNNSARKAIPELKTLMEQLEENTIKLAKLSNNNIDIASEYGMRTYSIKMKELFPAIEGLNKKNISKESIDEIFNIITSGGYQRAQDMVEQQNLNQTNEED